MTLEQIAARDEMTGRAGKRLREQLAGLAMVAAHCNPQHGR
jgi:hypothetical protein